MKRTAILCLTFLLFFSFQTQTHAQESGWRVPSWADTARRRFALTPVTIQEGKTLFSTYCAACHGKSGNGEGAPGMTFEVKPANFHDWEVMHQKDGTLFWKLSKGHGAMPGFAGSLSERQRWELIAYLRELAKNKGGHVEMAFENTKPVTGYKIEPLLKSGYFPLPRKVRNVIGSSTLDFMIDTVESGLIQPWSLAFLPDGKTMLIAERSGRLVIVRNGIRLKEPVKGAVPTSLRDVKLHPQFATNHLVYMSYYIEPVKSTRGNSGYAVIMRGKLEGDSLTNPQVLFKCGPFREDGFWYGNKIAFDNDGFMYVTIGQRTIEGQHRWNTAQDLAIISGKVIRLKDDGSVPKDNPFVDTAGALPEIYTLGHRMPEGLVYDRHTGKLWENEHGENGGCELNLLGPGKNYGWPKTTFSINYNGTIITTDTVLPGMELPAHHWNPALAPAGMDFVYGDRYPGWNGDLIIGSLVQKRLNRTIMRDGKVIGDEKLIQGIGRVRDVAVAPDGFLYCVTEDTGVLVRILPVKKGISKLNHTLN